MASTENNGTTVGKVVEVRRSSMSARTTRVQVVESTEREVVTVWAGGLGDGRTRWTRESFESRVVRVVAR